MQQDWVKGTEIFHIPSTTTYTQPPPLSESHTRVVYWVQPMRLLWHIIITQNPWLTLGFTLGISQSVGFDKCIMTFIHHYSITRNSLTALKILCAVPVYPSLPPTPGSHWSFYCLQNFAFFRMPYSWNHTVYSLFILASFS